MEILLTRIFKGEYTIGRLHINGVYVCDTLEDKVRAFGKKGEGKIPHETAIPAGRYRVIIRRSTRFRRNMPALLDVPFFEGILIHAGNTKEDTWGCILVGENKVKGMVVNSTHYFGVVFAEIAMAVSGNEKVFITIT